MKRKPQHKAYKHHLGFWCGWFYNDQWRENYHLLWNVSNEQITSFIKYAFNLDWKSENLFGGRTIEITQENFSPSVQIIAINEWTNDAHCHSYLSHEALHAAHHTLSNRGINFSQQTSETYCYLVEYIVRSSLSILYQRKKYS